MFQLARFIFWTTSLFFGSVALVRLVLPVAAWFTRPDAFWPVLPASMVVAAAGIVTVVFVLLPPADDRGPFPSAAMMMLMSITVSLWMFPSYSNHTGLFRSNQPTRSGAGAVIMSLPDTMKDFNYYTPREKIPVVTRGGNR